MSNVISLNVPPRRMRLSERTAPLIDTFARHRRIQEDVFWLKENAELLNILECTGQRVTQDALAPHEAFYAGLADRLSFFPQYYRFLLSIGLDLEDLGMHGTQMDALCGWVAQSGLPEAELSDLQRAEARRLLARRGHATRAANPGLDDRLRAFINRPETYAIPNKKAAYELTHIVFYLSEYGRRDPQLDAPALVSLEYAGLLAYLDQNMDLLAEICVALRQAGQVPHALWEGAVRQHLQAFEVCEDDASPLSDGYHDYLVSTWAVLMMGHDDSGAAVSSGRCLFAPVPASDSALRPMSAALLSMADRRGTHWPLMRDAIADMMSDDAIAVLAGAEASSDRFSEFFERFARAPLSRA